jgi:hypothetical protein
MNKLLGNMNLFIGPKNEKKKKKHGKINNDTK